MPTKTPLHAVHHSRRDHGDYTVEMVYFESLPGCYVTGNLYRPKGVSGKRPAVLSPHGHFPGGRFIDEGPDVVRGKIAEGSERFENGGRSFMQSRCVQLARMGCIVFHYDMIGYGDCDQIPLDVVHRFSRLRVKFKDPPPTGLYSAQALLHLHNPMGLQTYNSIRALDFLCGLSDVDPQRIAVTGGSGGGTQTFMLCAVDDRPLVSVPAVIVSTTRQGGCTCENISGLRIGTYNLEFTALHAPKPLLLISADDATRTMGERGYPELQQLYRALDAETNVDHAALLQFPHNYNAVSRGAMYRWLNQHLKLGLSEPIAERTYERLSREQLTVWNDTHPKPESSANTERAILEWLRRDARQQITELHPRDSASLERMRTIVGGAWDALLRGLPPDAHVTFQSTMTIERNAYTETCGLLRYETIEGHHAELPLLRIAPRSASQRVVIWFDGRGKASLYASDGALKPHIQDLVDGGFSVVGIDLLEQGEFLPPGRPIAQQRSLPGEEGFADWTYCYNLPLFARRVHDVLAVMELECTSNSTREITLVGWNGTGALVGAAVAQARGIVDRAAIDTGGFRFAALKDVYDVNFVPGAAKYGDVPMLLALAAPTPLWVAGERDETLPLVRAAYQAIGMSGELTVFQGGIPTADAAVKWIAADEMRAVESPLPAR